MPLRSDWSHDSCPVARSLDVIGDPWVLLIIRQAFYGSRRFADFRDALEIADNILARRLEAMVEAGLLARLPSSGDGRTRAEYALTPAGEDLLPILNAMLIWGSKHAVDESRPPQSVVHLDCGSVTESADRCTACGAALEPGSVAWRKTGRPLDRVLGRAAPSPAAP